MSRCITVLSKCLIVLLTTLCAALASADITGDWDFSLNVQGQTGSAEVAIEQVSDTEIKGTYVGQRFGEVDFKGTYVEGKLDFGLSLDAGKIVYEGVIQDDGTIEGSADLAGMAVARFTAKKRS